MARRPEADEAISECIDYSRDCRGARRLVMTRNKLCKGLGDTSVILSAAFPASRSSAGQQDRYGAFPYQGRRGAAEKQLPQPVVAVGPQNDQIDGTALRQPEQLPAFFAFEHIDPALYLMRRQQRLCLTAQRLTRLWIGGNDDDRKRP